MEFEFFLAEKMGRTVQELRETMSQHEFRAWEVYYARRAQEQERHSK